MSEQRDVDTETTPGASSTPRRRGRFRRWLVGLTKLSLLFLVLGVGFLGVAEHYTAQPQFCASCHIMEPYYETWENDPHGGRFKVACVDCHYAPGERSTIHAKLRGLSQVTSYFSGRYGATRPRAHVAPESCLTSSCHGTYDFMEKELKVGTITFKHSMHLNHSPEQEKAKTDRLAEIKVLLAKEVGEKRVDELVTEARIVEPTETRARKMAALIEGWGANAERALLTELITLEHRPVRVAQLASLQCVDCHANNLQDRRHMASTTAPQKGQHHFSVQKSSCYTCHFKNQAFNSGTAECMLCHEPPRKAITVHQQLDKDLEARLAMPALAKAAVKMDHADIVARNVDCRSCHADVIVGDSSVARRDCERCHDRESFFEDWKPELTTEQVAKYHSVHVPQQRAKCLDCHTQVQHQLASKDVELSGANFLANPLSDCTHCHTNQHRDVMNLLQGKGGHSIPAHDPNMMFGSRTNCFGCHTQADRINGSDVMVATQKACVACHGEKYATTFGQWKEMLDLSLREAQDAYSKARDRLGKAKDLASDARTKAQATLANASADLQLVLHGNGVHNVTFALTLLDSVRARCEELALQLETSK